MAIKLNLVQETGEGEERKVENGDIPKNCVT